MIILVITSRLQTILVHSRVHHLALILKVQPAVVVCLVVLLTTTITLRLILVEVM